MPQTQPVKQQIHGRSHLRKRLQGITITKHADSILCLPTGFIPVGVGGKRTGMDVAVDEVNNNADVHLVSFAVVFGSTKLLLSFLFK